MLSLPLLIKYRRWKMQVEKESKSVGLEKEDAMN